MEPSQPADRVKPPVAVPPSDDRYRNYINYNTFQAITLPSVNALCFMVEIILQSRSHAFLPESCSSGNVQCLSMQQKSYETAYDEGLSWGSLGASLALNIPLRGVGIYKACQEKKYVKIASHVASFTCLLFGAKGRALSVLIDVITGIYDAKRFSIAKSEWEVKSTLDPSKVEDAAKLLEIPNDKIKDYKFIKAVYDTQLAALADKWVRAQPAPYAYTFEQLMVSVVIAYETLSKDAK